MIPTWMFLVVAIVLAIVIGRLGNCAEGTICTKQSLLGFPVDK